MTELQIFTVSPVFQTVAGSAKSYAKPTNKYPAKKSTGLMDSDRAPP
jgi:DNA excision repair protein ERCC-4